MSPRPYKIDKRRAAAEQTRARVLEAARDLILANSVPPSIDAVAAHAGVARMTVYYQFGSRAGLLEALFDDLGGRHFPARLPRVFSQPEPLDAVSELIEVFYDFWAEHRIVTRRIRAMAALDPDFDQSIRGRDERRRQILRTLLERATAVHGKPSEEAFEVTVEILYALTSFAMYDALAAENGQAADIVPLVKHLARLALETSSDRS
jgi:AcrR family transcriptional regulator